MSDEVRQEASRMWRVWKTSKQMLYDRGYELTEEECNISFDDFRAQYCGGEGSPDKTKLSFSARPTDLLNKKQTAFANRANPHPTAQTGLIRVDFSSDPTIGIKQIRTFAQFLNTQNYFSGIFITPASLTSTVQKAATMLPIGVELFEEQDLLVNITRHELVPKHILLAPEEKKALLDRYRLKETQLPRIRAEDPVSKYLALKRGQVVKIIRKSETAGRYASYRWVI